MNVLTLVIEALDVLVVTYFGLYMLVNLGLLAISAFTVRRSLEEWQLSSEGTGLASSDDKFAPLISLLVPAYNEEVTIVESVRSLMRLEYPAYEVVVVNDGSKDRTIQVMKEAFQLVRSDVDYNAHLGTSPVRGFYRATCPLPKQVVRLVLVDKENGGKADALNVGINASQGTYVASMDADSLMIPKALVHAVQPILDNPNEVIACGGQIALSNGCIVADGKVIEARLPEPWIARFQVVEYMRSFTQSRVALGQMNSVLILSGVFAVFQRETVIAAGGFLSKHQRSRIVHEYTGEHSETVCEDMEVVVRVHRYLADHGLPGKIVFLPIATSWTEAPEIWKNLGKQRSRWYRGLWEVLWLHRGMMFNPRYGRVGLFALPYQLIFEALAPALETIGYVIVPFSWLIGILSPFAMLAFITFALSMNLLLSVGSVLVAIWRVRIESRHKSQALFDYKGAKALFILCFAGLISNLGYRQYLLYWQLKGLKDFLAGKKSWDKFARQGFAVAQKGTGGGQ